MIKCVFFFIDREIPPLPERERKGERRNIDNVYRNVERVFKENVRKKKSIMLPGLNLCISIGNAVTKPTTRCYFVIISVINLPFHPLDGIGWTDGDLVKKEERKKKA